MMMMNQGRKAMQILVGKIKAPSSELPPAQPEDKDASYGLESAAQKLMDSFHAKDVKGVVSALKDFLAMADEPESEESGD